MAARRPLIDSGNGFELGLDGTSCIAVFPRNCQIRKMIAREMKGLRNCLTEPPQSFGHCLMIKPRRNPLIQITLIALVCVLGIGSRRYSNALPQFIAAYAGDTLWAWRPLSDSGWSCPDIDPDGRLARDEYVGRR